MTTTKTPRRPKPKAERDLQTNAVYGSAAAAIDDAKACGYSVFQRGRKVAALRSTEFVLILGGAEDARHWVLANPV